MGNKNINRAFLCYSAEDSDFVIKVAKHLKGSINHIYYFQAYQQADDSFIPEIGNEIAKSDLMIVFVGKKFTKSEWQKREVAAALSLIGKKKKPKFVVIKFSLPKSLPKELLFLKGYPRIDVQKESDKEAYNVAVQILKILRLPLILISDLPHDPHLFSYEKDIIVIVQPFF